MKGEKDRAACICTTSKNVRTPWILIGVGAFSPNQMESDVLGYCFRSKNGSIGWVHAWGKSLGAVGLPGARWTPAAGADVVKVNESKVLVWPHPTWPRTSTLAL